MTWAVIHRTRILYRGTREACGAAAAEHGLSPRIVVTAADLDRGITRGALIMPVALLPQRLRRRPA